MQQCFGHLEATSNVLLAVRTLKSGIFALQEVVVLHDLPSDSLAAWFYKDAEASVELNLSSTKQLGDNTGKSSPLALMHEDIL